MNTSYSKLRHIQEANMILENRLLLNEARGMRGQFLPEMTQDFKAFHNMESKTNEEEDDVQMETELNEKCWAGYTQKGMKTMFGKRYPNCVKKKSVKEESEETKEASSPAQQAAIAINMKKKSIKPKNESLYEDEYGSVEETDYESDSLNEAEYQGRKVQLGKIMQGDVKKSKVYVKNDKGKVVKVNFGFGGKSAKGKIMRIKKDNPERRKNFRARHNCDNPGPRWKPRYWACRTW